MDVLRDDAESFASRLFEEGVPTRRQRYTGVYHGFFTEVGIFAATDTAINDVVAFGRPQLSPIPLLSASPHHR